MSMIWLEEFLQPSFLFLSDHESPDFKVVFCHSSEKYSSIMQELRYQKFKLVNLFTLDNKESVVKYYNLSNLKNIIIDEINKIAYLINPSSRTLEIICDKENRHSRKSLARVIRELGIGYFNTTGCPILHAAAISLAGKGVVIIGDKGAGKTTLLMSLLTEDTSNFISNDRVVLDINNSQTCILGLPTIVNVKKNTIDMFVEFKKNLKIKKYDYHLSMDEVNKGEKDSIQPDDQGNYSLSSFQFCSLIHSGQRPNANLNFILFPINNILDSKLKLARLSADSAIDKILQNIMGNNKNILNSVLFSDGINMNLIMKNDFFELFSRVTSRVKSYDFYIPRNSQIMPQTINCYLKENLGY